MKKLFALLALIMCLTLTACGGDAPESDSSTPNNTPANNDTQRAAELTEILCGSMWDNRDWNSELYFSEDGTVRFHYGPNEEDGIRTWEYSSYLNSFAEFTGMLQHDPEFSDKYGVYCGKMEQYGQMLIGCNEDGSYKMYFNGKFWDPVNNTPNIVEIELTAENFDTYFELVEVPIFHKNEFGETDEMDLYQYYLVREEYNVSDMTDFAIEYSCVWGRKDCEVDFTNLTYALSDFNDTTPPSNVMNDRFYDIEVNGQERFGFSIGGSGKSVKKSYGSIGEVGYSVDFEILQVKGTLFLIEE